MITALFGGSFDPIHLGHKNVVKSLLESSLGIDRVIIMPAFVNPFKAGNEPAVHASSEQRLEMCRLAFGDIPQCVVSDWEIAQGGVSYTVNTLEQLKKTYTTDKFILIMGSDSLASLDRWHRFEDIIRLADIAAVSRSDNDSRDIDKNAEGLRNMGARVHIVRSEPFEISSTEIRKKIINNQEISCYIDENVVKYIMFNEIYRTE